MTSFIIYSFNDDEGDRYFSSLAKAREAALEAVHNNHGDIQIDKNITLDISKEMFINMLNNNGGSWAAEIHPVMTIKKPTEDE